MERRAFLRTAALSTLAAASLSPLSLAQQGNIRQTVRDRAQNRRAGRSGRPTRVPIAVQLYPVRNAAAKDLAGTLAAIAKMGYDGVEFAGYYGKDPKELRKMLDDNNLKCAGTHTGFGELRGDRYEKTAEIHEILGTKFMIVPGGLPNNDLAKHKEWVDEFNKIAEKAKPRGLFIGYHAHGYDANLLEGIPSWERFFDATVPEVVMQMDLGNYKNGGGDPYKMIEKFKGRSRTVHLKEGGPNKPIIGEGNVEWTKAFDMFDAQGATEWYVVEDEHTPDSLDRIEKSVVALRGMGK